MEIAELLGREAELSSKTIGTGLTEIRKYSFGGFGYFYSGLFSYAIGLERVLKLTILADYYHSNNRTYPSNNKYLKSLSHNLSAMITEAQRVNSALKSPICEKLFADKVIQDIISILSDFANTYRYYNLDIVQGMQKQEIEPLARWDHEINSELLERHFKLTNKLQATKAACLSMQPAVVYHISEDGSVIDNLQDYSEYVIRIECKQKYSFLYLYRLVRYCVEVFREIEPWQHGSVFAIYCNTDSRALKKKIWNPYEP